VGWGQPQRLVPGLAVAEVHEPHVLHHAAVIW
jgi:hypothetical protein